MKAGSHCGPRKKMRRSDCRPTRRTWQQSGSKSMRRGPRRKVRRSDCRLTRRTGSSPALSRCAGGLSSCRLTEVVALSPHACLHRSASSSILMQSRIVVASPPNPLVGCSIRHRPLWTHNEERRDFLSITTNT